MPLPVAYSLTNWTAVLTCGATGAQQVANLGGMLTEFTPPEVNHVVIEKKFCGTGGVTPIATGTFDKMECGFKLEVTSDSLEAAIARGIAGAATLVITSIANSTASLSATKTLTYSLQGQITKMPFVFGLKAQEMAEAEFAMLLTGVSKTWTDASVRAINPIRFEVLEGVTNFLSDLKTGMNI